MLVRRCLAEVVDEQGRQCCILEASSSCSSPLDRIGSVGAADVEKHASGYCCGRSLIARGLKSK